MLRHLGSATYLCRHNSAVGHSRQEFGRTYCASSIRHLSWHRFNVVEGSRSMAFAVCRQLAYVPSFKYTYRNCYGVLLYRLLVLSPQVWVTPNNNNSKSIVRSLSTKFHQVITKTTVSSALLRIALLQNLNWYGIQKAMIVLHSSFQIHVSRLDIAHDLLCLRGVQIIGGWRRLFQIHGSRSQLGTH